MATRYGLDMAKGTPEYEAALAGFNFLKNYGKAEPTQEYWKEAMEYARTHGTTPLARGVLWGILKTIDEVQKNGTAI